MLKYLYHAVIGFGCVVFIATIYFLYGNFYLTLANSKEIASLVGKVSLVSPDMKRFALSIDRIKEKAGQKTEAMAADPFFPPEQ